MSGLAPQLPIQAAAAASSSCFCANTEDAESCRTTNASVSYSGVAAGIRGSSSRYQRPPGHFCAACGCLMLSSERQPIRLEPCGHTTCSRCAGGGSVIVCPTCRVSAVRGRLNSGLQQEVLNFSGVSAGCNDSCASNQPVNEPVTNQLTVVQIQPQSVAAIARLEASHSIPQHQEQSLQSYRQQHSETTKRWHQQLDMISGRMRALEGTLEQLHAEQDALNRELAAEINRDRQLKQAEVETREKIEQLQEEIRKLAELRAASKDGQHFIQSQIEAKKQAIQAAFTAQHNVTMELSKLQSLCGGGILSSSDS